MVQLRILCGKMAGTNWVARRFPVRVGRSPESDLQLEEQGVWNDHFQIHVSPDTGFVLETQPDALVTANGQATQRAVLANGDLIEIGSVKLQFWIGDARRRSLGLSEWVVWVTIAAVSLAQIAIAYFLPH